MSIMNPLPPQAYTKDTLVQAYAWLQGQSENIKELATTPDVLVSLYLKAKMQGNGALERPSIQNFKSELKNLAGMIGEFEVVEQQGSTNGRSTELATSTIRFRSQDIRSSESTKSLGSSSAPMGASAHPHAHPNPPPPPQQQHSYTHTQAQRPSQQQQSYHSQQSFHQQTTASYNAPVAPAPAQTSKAEEESEISRLDSRSLDMIQEVKIQFNLSSDTEALRLLVSIGYNHVKNLIK